MKQSGMVLMYENDIDTEEHKSSTTNRYFGTILEDQRLKDRIERALSECGYRALSVVRVSVSTRVVRLRGQVCSYHLKQRAQEIALSFPGIQQLRNDLDVVHPERIRR